MSRIDPERMIQTDLLKIELTDELSGGLILDIGGGGEGIIGKIYGRDVVAIDPRLDELEESVNDAVKVEMSACDLRFTADSFDAATSFFTMMYIDPDDIRLAAAEIMRVLKPGGRLEIWDTEIPAYDGGGRDIFLLNLEVGLPEKSAAGGGFVTTGYGVGLRKDAQNAASLADLFTSAGFILESDSELGGGLFRLSLRKGQ